MTFEHGLDLSSMLLSHFFCPWRRLPGSFSLQFLSHHVAQTQYCCPNQVWASCGTLNVVHERVSPMCVPFTACLVQRTKGQEAIIRWRGNLQCRNVTHSSGRAVLSSLVTAAFSAFMRALRKERLLACRVFFVAERSIVVSDVECLPSALSLAGNPASITEAVFSCVTSSVTCSCSSDVLSATGASFLRHDGSAECPAVSERRGRLTFPPQLPPTLGTCGRS